MKEKLSKIIFAVLACAILAAPAFSATAQAEDELVVGEAIESFSSDIQVRTDNSIDVVETIEYSTGPISRHGIYRNIYPYSSEDRRMSIENVTVTDEEGNPHMFEVSNKGKSVRIKIGDPDKTFKGYETYVISYKATHAVAHLDDVDEIYWNVTGNDWEIPIHKVSSSVTLPDGASVIRTACYLGAKGSKEMCSNVSGMPNEFAFESTRSLDEGEGMTVAVGFPKGIVAPYSAADDTKNFLEMYLTWILGILLPVLTFSFSLWHWHKKGRDPKGTGVIVPQYEVLDGLTPMEVGGIVKGRANSNDVSAEIVYIATRGFIKITQLEKKTLGLFKTNDYEFEKLKDSSELENEHDRIILDALFKSGESKVKLSELQYKFYSDSTKATSKALDTLLAKGYYSNLGGMKFFGAGRWAMSAFFSVWAAGFFGGIIGAVLLRSNPFPLMGGIFLSVIIFAIVSSFFPAKSVEGVAAKEYLLGLKDYLQIAEKDRLEFHNAPEKKPEVFEKLLPYAMVLGVLDVWAKEFADLHDISPAWYASSNGAHFNSIVFANSMSSFSAAASSSLSSTPGGSGGGGSSGGGGGGGGGGGW
ncbi:MAG TPA: DUF2207 domain-containing protein [Candidatus Paceibacterota bacterium]